ncbi:MAG: cyclic lactone autoinducer peptide [Bacillota bacterium]
MKKTFFSALGVVITAVATLGTTTASWLWIHDEETPKSMIK